MRCIPRGQTPERRAYMKAWNATNPRDRSTYKRTYDAAHRTEAAAYRRANQERLRAKKAAWYRANRLRVLASVKARSVEKKADILSYQTYYYAANIDKVKANVAAYKAANPDRVRYLENRRRARKVGNGGSHTLVARLEKFAGLGNVCFYCHARKPLTVDHDVPLARGGTDDITNILPACRSCNSKKRVRTATEFLGVGPS